MTDIDLDEYNYDLPREKIAQYPLPERDSSKVLVYRNGVITEGIFGDLDRYIPSGSLLVFNNTKVIKARLLFHKDSGAWIEILCLEPLSPAGYDESLSSKDAVEWKCIVGNLKKWKSLTAKAEFRWKNRKYELTAHKLNPEGDAMRIRFIWNCTGATFAQVIEAAGHTPLPPYIERPDEMEDSKRYQTIYSMIQGSVAAPTAGLHFTLELLRKLYGKEITTTEVTLHVGAGTFQPIKSGNVLSHQMHSEHFFLNAECIEMVLKNQGSVIPVGTTSVRTLESLYWLGVKLLYNPDMEPLELYLDQWEEYTLPGTIPAYQSLETILAWMQKKRIHSLHATTRILIIPGYEFRMINGMITNFHLPRSTLLLLISAWVGSDWKKIYDYALDNSFRFLSYGDGSILFR
jgi:S-adenosylmethionine:tRNA ribosyltransferase-isomerase